MEKTLSPLPMGSLDRNGPQPLFDQIHDVIVDWIELGALKENEPIPSERELSERFRVSRLTVRRAIDALVEQGILFRQHGKGTFISGPKLIQPLLVVRSFTDAMLQEGRTPGTRVQFVDIYPGRAGVCRRLNIAPGEIVIEFVRVRFVDSVPIARISSYLPVDLLPGITSGDLEHSPSLYTILRDKYGHDLAHSRITLEPVVANYSEAAELAVQPRQPLMLLRGLVFTPKGRVIEYCKAVYRGDKVRFAIESSMNAEMENSEWPNIWP